MRKKGLSQRNRLKRKQSQYHRRKDENSISRIRRSGVSSSIRRKIRKTSSRSSTRNVERKYDVKFRKNVSTENLLQKLSGKKRGFKGPIGKNYDVKSGIFYSGKRISGKRYQSIAVLIEALALDYKQGSKKVLWWRRVKEFRPKTLTKWSEKLKTKNFKADLEYQIETSGGQFVRLIGFEGVK